MFHVPRQDRQPTIPEPAARECYQSPTPLDNEPGGGVAWSVDPQRGAPGRPCFVHHGVVGYALIDVGGAARLERFGDFLVDRPQSTVFTPPEAPERWDAADLRFEREAGWTGAAVEATQTGWSTEVVGLTMELRLTDAGQVGLFPEHLALVPWLETRIASRIGRLSGGGTAAPEPPAEPPVVKVLHLFGYTGLLSLVMARAGAAVVHVDAARPALAWARRNATASGLDDRPIRWIQDDALRFTAREMRRERRYDGILLDPPSYGHGGSGQTWRIEDDLLPLLRACRRLVTLDGFVLLTAHTDGFGGAALESALVSGLGRPAGTVEHGDLRIEADSGPSLRLGAYARWDGQPG